MTYMTKARAAALLEKYYAALEQIAEGKSVTFATENGNRTLTHENLSEIRRQITVLERRVTNKSGAQHNTARANLNANR